MPAILRVGGAGLELEPVLLALARSRVEVARFAPPTRPRELLAVRRVERASPSAVLLPGPVAGIRCELVPGELRCELPDEPFAAEAVIKVGVCELVLRQGGLLFHASAAHFAGRAVIAVGPSGAGKSTLARWALAAGGALLSDETVGLLPDGTALATPFRSDPDLTSAGEDARAVALLAIRHGPTEALAPMPPDRAVALLLQQAYRSIGPDFPRAELLRRSSALASALPMEELTCRNAPSAGQFLRRRAEAG